MVKMIIFNVKKKDFIPLSPQIISLSHWCNQCSSDRSRAFLEFAWAFSNSLSALASLSIAEHLGFFAFDCESCTRPARPPKHLPTANLFWVRYKKIWTEKSILPCIIRINFFVNFLKSHAIYQLQFWSKLLVALLHWENQVPDLGQLNKKTPIWSNSLPNSSFCQFPYQIRHFVNFLTKFVILHISLQFCVQNVKRLFLLLNFCENTVLGYKKWSKINFENIFHILLIRKIIFIRFYFKKFKNNDFRAFFH